MSIDVIDVFRLEAGIFDGQSHAFRLLDAFRSRSRNVISVGIAAITADFTVDMSTAFLSVFQFFEEDDTGTFAHDETVAVFIEGTRCMSRVIVARAQGFHSGKAGDSARRNSGFRTAGNGSV